MIILCQRFLKNTKISAITIFPFIILKDSKFRNDRTLLNHEKIHLRQQIELLLFFFYLWYVLEYFYWLYKFKNREKAYRNISFEQEAYAEEGNFNYLKERKLWNFLHYLKQA